MEDTSRFFADLMTEYLGEGGPDQEPPTEPGPEAEFRAFLRLFEEDMLARGIKVKQLNEYDYPSPMVAARIARILKGTSSYVRRLSPDFTAERRGCTVVIEYIGDDGS